MRNCVECKGPLRVDHSENHYTIGEVEIAVTVPARRCAECKTAYVSGPVSEAAELFVASQLLGRGIATGAAFRFMRKALGLRATDLADLLDIDAATVSRWETGKVPVDRAALATLSAAASERLEGHSHTIDSLRAVREGHGPAKAGALRLDLPAKLAS